MQLYITFIFFVQLAIPDKVSDFEILCFVRGFLRPLVTIVLS